MAVMECLVNGDDKTERIYDILEIKDTSATPYRNSNTIYQCCSNDLAKAIQYRTLLVSTCS